MSALIPIPSPDFDAAMVRHEEHLFRHFRYSEEQWSSVRAELAKVITGPDAARERALARARKGLLFTANSYIENRAKYGKRIRNPKGARLMRPGSSLSERAIFWMPSMMRTGQVEGSQKASFRCG